MNWRDGWIAESLAEDWSSLRQDLTEYLRRVCDEIASTREVLALELVFLDVRLDSGTIRCSLESAASRENGRALSRFESSLVESELFKIPDEDEVAFNSGYKALMHQTVRVLVDAADEPAVKVAIAALRAAKTVRFFVTDCGDDESAKEILAGK